MYLQLAEQMDISPYISVPTSQGLVQVREDYFDTLPPAQWEQVMNQLAPFQPSAGLSELSDRETRRRRKEARTLKKEARAADVASGARAERRAATFGKVTDALGKVAGAAANLLPGAIPGLPGGGVPDATVTPEPVERGGLPKWVIPVGIGVAGLGLVYFLTRKKK